MSQPSSLSSPTPGDSPRRQAITIARCDRWQFHQRLQELGIPCGCLENGQIWVDVEHPTTALQIWSILRQLTAARPELVDWLTRCWQIRY